MTITSRTKSHLHYALLSFAVLVVIAIPLIALAQTSLTNPLGDVRDPNVVIANIIKTLLGVVGAIALLFFVYGGFLMLTSGGGPERVKKGRDTLMWATLGLIIIFGSYGITETIFKAISGT